MPMRDVFYYGNKPNVHPREKFAKDINDARRQCTTEHFWIINEFCDYTNFDWDFDFDFLPDEDVWAQDHNNIWPSQHQKDSGTWLCSKNPSEVLIYRTDVDIIIRKRQITHNWVLLDNVDETKFDFSWHPDPTDPPYIYRWGCVYYPVEIQAVLEYRVPGAERIKYMDAIVPLDPQFDRWKIYTDIDKNKFDFSWRPDPREPPFIYRWGNKYEPAEIKPTLDYVMPGATEIKYMSFNAPVLPQWDRWENIENIDKNSFDFTWRPDPREPNMIFQFGTQHQKTGGPRYVSPDATEVKYIDGVTAKILPNKDNQKNFKILHNYKIKDFDYSWHPDETDEPYIYVFGNQYYSGETMPTIEYHVKRATQRKYVDTVRATLGPDKTFWLIPENIDTTDFDFSWKPNPFDPPYIYKFGTQHQKTGGPEYWTPEATEIKYIDFQKAKALPRPNDTRWQIPEGLDISEFDFSWHPDDTDKPYIYQFGTQWALTGGPRYVMPEATEIKYIEEPIAKAAPNKTNWEIPDDIDVDSFDFSWHPYVEDQPYIYQFGTQHQKTGGPRYHTPGTDEMSATKFIDTRILKAKKLPKPENFIVEAGLVIKDFDYSWHPDETDGPYIYVFGNNQYPAEIMPTVKYIVPGATKVKYVNDIKATLAENMSNWKILLDINTKHFDFSWVPDPTSPPYIYVWGNQWNSAELEPTVEYHVPGATEKKYISDSVATVLPNKNKWKKLHDIVDFDFSWRPNPTDPPYIYVFGNQHHNAEKMPTLTYTVKGATDKKYINDIVAKLAPKFTNWNILIPVDKKAFDFSWMPDPYDPPYIYVFGNQWNDATIEPTLEYVVVGAKEKKYIIDVVAKVIPQPDKFEMLIDIDDFDFSWRPNPKDPPYIYIFGNQWNKAEKEPTIRYKVAGATEYKYVNDVVATTKANFSLWEIPQGFAVDNFDFTWRPDPYDPPYVYEFATEYADRGGPLFKVQGATEVKYMSHIKAKLKANVIPTYTIETTLEDLISQHSNEVFWALQKSINYDRFDFNWRPTKDKEQYVHVFGSPESEKTQTYFVNASLYLQGFTDRNFVEQDKVASEEYLAELFIQPDIFLVDKGNSEAQERFEQLKSRFPNVSKTRFLNSWVDTINRCINRSNTELCWILNSELDYSNFDFKYYPNPWQLKMIHVFGTQWSHWGTTFMVNRETFSEDTKYIKIIEHLSNLNFVKDRRAIATNNLYDIILIDHGNKEINEVLALLEKKAQGKKVTVVKYEDSYFNTIKKLIADIITKKEHYIWICSSVCDYRTFDFSYICDPFAKDHLHVFPSDKQKFGDTFLIDINKTKEIINDIDILQAYHKVNYNQHQKVKRLPAPIINVSDDTHVGIIKEEFDFPYAIFKTEDVNVEDQEPMNLWTEDTKNILVTSTGATRIIVPKEARDYVEKELYDYPYIKTASKLGLSKPLDIIFLSNGEKCADENYEHLLAVTKGLKNRVVRVDGINGRVQAYHAALEASETNWAFTVFAKLKVDNKFDWGWQPDRLQIPKHYVFHAKNPVNGLEYGHQGMIAYNKKLTLNNTGKGLDFTLDDPHETVRILSGVANFNTDKYNTWRTAFREVIKLKSDYTDISKDRLNVWLTKANGKFAKDCLQGANDAVEYYDSVHGDIDQLKLSYEWDWLKKYYNKKYK